MDHAMTGRDQLVQAQQASFVYAQYQAYEDQIQRCKQCADSPKKNQDTSSSLRKERVKGTGFIDGRCTGIMPSHGEDREKMVEIHQEYGHIPIKDFRMSPHQDGGS
ncbi:hypothetical protein WISP_122523 [Willisornis vidua]|uniref:Uncharacterized protein n=1 Tax=Willisornis vidua TaxID=1566151 RepID=A0ABQ9CYD4_9PASS|nr:hypothetical protein WISP_122523 [Willisornis vidua]